MEWTDEVVAETLTAALAGIVVLLDPAVVEKMVMETNDTGRIIFKDGRAVRVALTFFRTQTGPPVRPK